MRFLRSIPCVILVLVLVIGVDTAYATTLAPGEQLLINFSISGPSGGNDADMLWLVSYADLTVTGSPDFTVRLYDGSTQLASISTGLQTTPPAFRFLFLKNGTTTSFTGNYIGYGDFSTIHNETIDGWLAITVSGGSISGDFLNPANGAFADRVSSTLIGKEIPDADTHYGNVSIKSVEIAAVPEPASFLLLGTGLGMIGLAALRGKR
jgi:hypothetical protein